MPFAPLRPRCGRTFLFYAAFCGLVGGMLHGAAELEISAASDHLPGHPGRLALGASLQLRAPAPAGASVTWYRNGVAFATTAGDLDLINLTTSDTGNYQARWGSDPAAETALLPITVGALPTPHFGTVDTCVGQRYFSAELNIERLLDDGRVVGRSTTWGGVGQYHHYFAAHPGPDEPRTTLFNYNWTTGSFLGALGDGSFYITTAPHRYTIDGTAAPFSLPSVFSASPPYHLLDRGARGIVLLNSEHLVGASRDGTVIFAHTPARFGATYFHSATALRDGRIAVHLQFSAPDGNSATGETIRLNTAGAFDPTFQAIANPSPYQFPVELADGSWRRIDADGLSGWTADGVPTAKRSLPIDGLNLSLSLAPDGSIYARLPELGLVRYRASDLELDGTFYLPDQEGNDWNLTFPFITDTGRVIVAATPVNGPSTAAHLAGVQAIRDHSDAVPVVGSRVLSYSTFPYDNLRHFLPFERHGSTGPRAGEALRLFCPYFGDGITSVQWIALDGTAAMITRADGTGIIPGFSSAYAGRYQLVVTNAAGRALGPVVDLRPQYEPRLSNLSGRARVTTSTDAANAGFVLRPRSGAAADADLKTPLLLRGIGPTLADFDIAAPLPDPRLELHRLDGTLLAQNDDWAQESTLTFSVFERVGAFTPPVNSKDAMLHRPLGEGAFTILTLPQSTGSGIALTEIYLDDTDFSTRNELANLSLRGWAGNESDVLVAGFVIEDPDQLGRSLRLLIRGVGPALAGYGIDAPLADPVLRIFNAAGDEIAFNDNWSAHADNAEELAASAQTVGAFSLTDGSSDAALLIDLPAGAYTAHVQPQATTIAPGIALLEIYVVD